ncbi:MULTISPECIES: barstar family protein [Microbacterium]|uniref:barstar family protein n=1 Tax=Microbacterium TaxID=33882 RepID=UPI0018E2BC99|nr:MULTISPECIES: barstar family protein [Microbacterium]
MTSLAEPVHEGAGTAFVTLAGQRKEVAKARWNWNTELGLAVRVVRGRKMRVLAGVFNEFAAALQFPTYFGENKAAFDECIREADEFSRDAGLVVLLTEPDQILADEPVESLSWLIWTLEAAAVEWGMPIALGEWWDRPALPFHVVLAGDDPTIADSTSRWEAAGLSRPGTVDATGEISSL